MITPDRKPKDGVVVNKVGNKSVLMPGSQKSGYLYDIVKKVCAHIAYRTQTRKDRRDVSVGAWLGDLGVYSDHSRS